MKVLVATRKTQGQRSNDFCYSVEGELVVFPPVECGRGSVDDRCGCRRSMAGLASHRATTTMEVVDRPELNRGAYLELIADGLATQGYLAPEGLDPETQQWVETVVEELIDIAALLPTGTVLERRGDHVAIRRQPDRHL